MFKGFFLSIVLLFSSQTFCNSQENQKQPLSTILTNWIDFHCNMVRSAKGISHVAYSRHFSYTAIAAYESVVSSDHSYQSITSQLKGSLVLPTFKGIKTDPSASLNAAYAEMLR